MDDDDDDGEWSFLVDAEEFFGFRYCVDHGGTVENERINALHGVICERCRWEQVED